MTSARTDDPPRSGLRERKKAQTRAQIQEHALRLFHAQGYEATSVEEIAAAADVSPSTVFRYFPTKPDLIIYDDIDDRMIAAFRAQPPELSAIAALRGAFRASFGGLAISELAMQRERGRLLQTVPELRAAMLGEFARTWREIADLLAERTGRSVDDETVMALAGAVFGMAIAAWLASQGDDWMDRFMRRIDTDMALLESGFRL